MLVKIVNKSKSLPNVLFKQFGDESNIYITEPVFIQHCSLSKYNTP